MRYVFKICFTFLVSAGLVWVQPVYGSDVRDAILKVFVTSNSIDYYRPWQSHGNSSKTGSAVVIGGKRILTNAHVVSDHTFIQVRKASDPKKYTAKVLAIGHDCDLALLTVEDDGFFEEIMPLELGELPKLQDTVAVIGYPTGGDKLSITEGVVSRVDIVSYVQSSRKLLTVQIDAAINSGNSGGPVIQNGKIVGIAMQGITSSQSIGYMIPTPIINHFFEDLKDENYEGFPMMGIDINTTENAALREYYKISDQEGGVVISQIIPGSSADGTLSEGDVVFALDGIDIGVDGTFSFRKDERLGLSYLINKHQIGDTIKVKFSRNGKMLEKNVVLKETAALVYPPKYLEKPSYFIYGGLAFTTLSVDLLKAWGGEWWQKGPLDMLYYLFGVGRFNYQRRDELVVLLHVFPDDLNVGYHGYSNQIVRSVNGKSISSLEDLVKILTKQKGKYTYIETETERKIILDNTNIDQINQEIIKRNNIPAQYSDDVAQWVENR